MISKKKYLLIILIFGCLNLKGQINLEINASSVSGTAPLYVFFDATESSGLQDGTDLINTDFSWNFDSTGLVQETTISKAKGMVSGFVFEEPGNYTVECTARDPEGNIETETIQISVLPFSGITYYVSENGNDNNDGLTEDTAWQTANHAFQQLTTNTRILFERGGIFPNITESLNNLHGGSMIIGAYGEGELPVLQANENWVVFIDNSEGIALVDLHLEINNAFATGCLDVQNNSTDILGLRVEMEGATGRTIYQDESSLLGIFNCYLHDTGVIGVFSGDSSQFSFVNNIIDNLIGAPQPEHGMRIQGGEKQFIAHNTLSRINDTKTAITIRGDGQRHVVIYKNKIDRILEVNPENASATDAISLVTIEGNYIGHSINYVGQDFQNAFSAINIEATQVAIRNNIIDGHTNAVRVHNDGNGVVSGDVTVYHNTFNWRPSADLSATLGRLVLVQNSANVNIRNNLMSIPESDMGVILQVSGSSNVHENNNILTVVPNYLEVIHEADSHINDILNYQLTGESPGVNSGDNSVPVFFDAINVSRPLDSHKDVGAFEYVDETLSNQKEESIDLVKVYPNPFKNFLSIETPLKEEVEIIIVTLVGKAVFKSQLHSFNNIFDTSDFKNGMYLLQIKTSKKSRVYKLIK
ncbi:T9SS type A sorting domain-containing protein [Tenacibaculum xiamenense]|uniref:T9SS type A sorting domain-containing protein n=1 Tax=Tenacibaculum xiamenense TaxID=1261553 RepID=UPI0038947C8C